MEKREREGEKATVAERIKMPSFFGFFARKAGEVVFNFSLAENRKRRPIVLRANLDQFLQLHLQLFLQSQTPRWPDGRRIDPSSSLIRLILATALNHLRGSRFPAIELPNQANVLLFWPSQ